MLKRTPKPLWKRLLTFAGGLAAGLAALQAALTLFNAVPAVLFGPRTVAYMHEAFNSGATVTVKVASCFKHIEDVFEGKGSTQGFTYTAGRKAIDTSFVDGKWIVKQPPWAIHFAASSYGLMVANIESPGTLAVGEQKGFGYPRLTREAHRRLCGPDDGRTHWSPIRDSVIVVKYLEPLRQPIVVEDHAALAADTKAWITFARWFLLLLGIASFTAWRGYRRWTAASLPKVRRPTVE